MIQFAEWFAPALLRASVALAIAAIVVAMCVKLLRLRSPAAEQMAWLLVLIQGVVFFSFTVGVSSQWLPRWDVASQSTEVLDSHAQPVERNLAIAPGVFDDSIERSVPPLASRRELASPNEAPGRAAPSLRHWLPAWQLIVCIAWIAGVITIVLASVGRYARFVQRSRSGAAASPEWESDWNRMCKGAGVGAQIPLVVTRSLGPALCRLPSGYKLVIPGETWATLSSSERCAIYRHELEHYRRGDLWWTLGVRLLATLHWFNPCAWWAAGRFEAQSEFACDAAAAGDNPTRFSELLVQLASGRAPRIVGVQSVAATSVYERVQRLLTGGSRSGSWRVIVPVAMAVLALGFAVVRFEPIAGPSVAVAAVDDAQEAEPAKAVEQDAEQKVEAPSDVAPDEIAGVVVDADGKPIADAMVDAWHWHPGNETTTDERGEFRLRGLDRKRRAEVRVTKDGYSPAYFPQLTVGGKGLTVRLNDKTYIEGIVTGADGKPVTGGEIRAAFGPVQGDGVLIGEVLTLGKVGPDGKYRLYLKPDTYDIQFTAPGQGVKRLSKVVVENNNARTLPVALEPGVRFEARVVDSESGGPVEGFVLYQWQPPHLLGRSDADGRIVLADLPPGKIEFNCGWSKATDSAAKRYYQHGPFGRWWSEQATSEFQRKSIDDSQTKWQRNFDGLSFDLELDMPPVEIVVERGVTISGRVTDPDGNPVAGATVAPAKTGSGNSITGDTRYSVVTKEDGSYSVVMPASNAARYNLIVHDGKFQEWRKWANGVREPIQTTPGQVIENYDLQLTQPAVVRGQVIKDGKPAANLDVRTHAVDKLENRYYDPTTRTDKDGKFELKFVRPGKHYLQVEPFWITAEDSPGGSKIIEVKAGDVLDEQGLVAEAPTTTPTPLPESLKFQARVVDPDGKPVAGASVGVGARGGAPVYRASLLEHFAKMTQQAVPPLPATDEEGLVEVDASNLSAYSLGKFLVYAVDHAGIRAGIAELKPEDYATADATSDPQIIKVTVRPAAETVIKLNFDTVLAQAITKNERLMVLTITREGAPFQQLLAKDEEIKLLLPEGTYEVGTADWFADRMQLKFKVTADAGSRVDVEIKPSRLASLIGRPAPELTKLKPAELGNPTLADLKGQVVLLEFWGHWCGPCVATMPNLIQLHDEFKDLGLSVVAVHDDSVGSYEELQRIVERLQSERWNGKVLAFPVVLDDGGELAIEGSDIKVSGATTATYGITGWPTTVLIDRAGRTRGIVSLHDIEATRERLRELLAEPAS